MSSRARSPWKTALYHPIYPRLLCALLIEKGVDSSALLTAAGLSPSVIGPASSGISQAGMGALVLQARRLCTDPLLALEWGSRAQSHVHGTFSTAILCSQDVREALQAICRLSGLRGSVVDIRFQQDVQQARLRVLESIVFGGEHAFILEALAVALVQLLAPLLGASLSRLRVELPFARPAWAAHYPRYIPCPVSFNATSLNLVMPSELLDIPCPTADMHAHAAAVRQCELDVLQHQRGEMSGRIHDYLSQVNGPYPNLVEAAQALGTSPRTLSRVLKAEGGGYQSLLDQTRQEVARAYLRDTQLSIEQLGDRLGFSDTSNFIRAFRRWYGITPQQYRAGQRTLG